jgi:hypothetical protein
MSLMWFYDEVPEEYRRFREEAQALEKEHLETRTALREAQAAQRADPENPAHKARVRELETRLADLDKRAPWISRGELLEMLLWGGPH